jgi:hypothetical protein
MLSVIVAASIGGCISDMRSGKKPTTKPASTIPQPGTEIFRGNEFMPSVGNH